MERFDGVQDTGFINRVEIRGNKVYKLYAAQISTVVDSDKLRFCRERQALNFFGGSIAPRKLQEFPYMLIAVMSRLPGVNAKSIIEHGLSEAKERKIFYDLGLALRQVHHTPVRTNISSKNYAVMVFNKLRQDFQKFLASGVPKITCIDMKKLETALENQIFPLAQETISSYSQIGYTHGDFWTNNSLIELPRRSVHLSGIIDWEFAKTGVPEEDLSQLVMWEFSKRPELQGSFEDGYKTKIDSKKIAPFIILKLIDYLSGASVQDLAEEKNDPEKFLTMHIQILKQQLLKWTDAAGQLSTC